MIITRTPLRISLGGGGTDLPSYYRNHGEGFLIAAAITKYVYIAVNDNFDDDLLLKYSEVERVSDRSHVRHPLLRECLISQDITGGIEISSMADIPTGTGLGSSGSFTVGVLKALNHLRHGSLSNLEIATEACRIEIEKLSEPVGKQDQFIAALGGITAFTFRSDESVHVEPLTLSSGTRSEIEENLLLFFTGLRRSASEVLAEERNPSRSTKVNLDNSLSRTREIGYETRAALLSGNLSEFGQILTRQWELKLQRQQTPTNTTIDGWIRAGIAAGAHGGKLVGAGGGGFLLFYAEEKAKLREQMTLFGLQEVRFGFDYEGSALLVAR
jgi:D-glycero-alpha-D-manno-heptose-7-phosphate kinase